MSRRLPAAALAVGLLASSPLPGQAVGPRSAELERILERLAERAAVYERTALRFACREEASLSEYDGDEVVRKQVSEYHDYLLEYSDRDGLVPYRALLARNAEPAERHQVKPEYGIPEPYGWNLLFTRERQGRFQFRLVDKDILHPHLVWVVEFQPLLSYIDGGQIDEWEGMAWVDQDTLDLLRLEAVPAHQDELLEARLAQYRQAFRFLGMAAKKRPRLRRLQVEFGHELEGLRFPSRSFASIRTVSGDWTERLQSSVALTFSSYQFFGTDMREEFDKRRAPAP